MHIANSIKLQKPQKRIFAGTSKFPALILTSVSAKNPSLRSGTMLFDLKTSAKIVFASQLWFG
jgi:hypothetical protein